MKCLDPMCMDPMICMRVYANKSTSQLELKNEEGKFWGTTDISVALIQETPEGQKPIYFTSKALQGPEVRYQQIENVERNFFLALIHVDTIKPRILQIFFLPL